MLIRLSKYLADSGVCSRRRAEALILGGFVQVNGETVAELGTKADTETDAVTYKGALVRPISEHVYIMLHKPEGVVCTVSDEQGRPTVMPLVAGVPARLVPVGRLDYNTSGLLLMTDDGELTYKLTHPKHRVQKTYIAKLEGTPNEEALRAFRKGLFIEDYKTSPAKIIVVKQDERAATVKITIGEGRNRQVRKMCEAIGHKVVSLKRVATGQLKLGELEKGKFRRLTAEEVAYLKGLA